MTVRFYIDPATDQPHIHGHSVVKDAVEDVLSHCEMQSDVEAVAEDEAAYRSTTTTVMKIPVRLVPAIRALLAKRRAS